MYIVREIFHLQFGKYKEAKALTDEAIKHGMLSQGPGSRVLTDFTGGSYRLIYEMVYPTLAAFEADLAKEMGGMDWKAWYEKFKPLVRHSEREILKQVS